MKASSGGAPLLLFFYCYPCGALHSPSAARPVALLRGHATSCVRLSEGFNCHEELQQERLLRASEGFNCHEELQQGRLLRYTAKVMYDGVGFRGFQLQPGNYRTVQGELEKALQKRFQRRISVLGASRTDAGVHSRGQVVHFDLPASGASALAYDPAAMALLQYCLNQMLPEDVRVYGLAPVPLPSPQQRQQGLPWSANVNARAKLYTYRLSFCDVTNPLDARQRAHYPPVLWPVDLGVLEATLAFSSKADKSAALVAAAGRGDRDTVRTVVRITLRRGAPGYIDIDVLLDGALYKMVRYMVGAAVAVAAGRMDARVITTSLLSGNWEGSGADKSAAAPAPACGLTLEEVFYEEPFQDTGGLTNGNVV
ncbi:pseudouridine synthase [Tribonema minus]|uniref:tRNA pseudouridine synthase n=1 Tax=Tribonema minus TaxID=303371 RepID=A0A836CB05_9STRA|nr:pseudouridine synthase [Tribonema minus]